LDADEYVDLYLHLKSDTDRDADEYIDVNLDRYIDRHIVADPDSISFFDYDMDVDLYLDIYRDAVFHQYFIVHRYTFTYAIINPNPDVFSNANLVENTMQFLYPDHDR
jgi:hypothetical protein